MKLIVVRHGETEANVKKIIQGQTQGILTEKGKEQAFLLGKRLVEEKIDKIYCSDLQRAKDTAAEILKSIDVIIEYVPELREMKKGVFEGKPGGSLFKHIKEKGLDRFQFRPEGGETLKEVRERTISFYEKMLDEEKGKTILWITHGTIATGLMMYLADEEEGDYREYIHKNCAISIVEVDDNGKHEIKKIKCIEHLQNNHL